MRLQHLVRALMLLSLFAIGFSAELMPIGEVFTNTG